MIINNEKRNFFVSTMSDMIKIKDNDNKEIINFLDECFEKEQF